MKNRTAITVSASIAAVALALTGCSDSGGKVSSDAPSGSNAPSSTSSEEPAAEEYADYGDEEVTETATFGQAVAFPNDISISVSKPEPYTFDPEMDFGGEGYPHHVQLEVKVVNKSGQPFDPEFLATTLQSGNREGDEIFGETTGDGLMTKVLDGREGTYTVAYGVDDPDDIVMEVEDYDTFNTAIFTSEQQ